MMSRSEVTREHGKRYQRNAEAELRLAVRKLASDKWNERVGTWPNPEIDRLIAGERRKRAWRAADTKLLGAVDVLRAAGHPAVSDLEAAAAQAREMKKSAARDAPPRTERAALYELARSGWLPMEEDPFLLAVLVVLLDLDWSPRWDRNRNDARLRGKGITASESLDDIAQTFRLQSHRT
jgi:hypothetical protein